MIHSKVVANSLSPVVEVDSPTRHDAYTVVEGNVGAFIVRIGFRFGLLYSLKIIRNPKEYIGNSFGFYV